MQTTVFFGGSAYVLPIIEAIRKDFDLKLVITTDSKPTDPVPHYCIEQHIPYLSVTKLDASVIAEIKAIHASFAVLAYFGLIVPQTLLDLFPKGIINIHPSLLPTYRGSTPVQSTLLAGDTKTGVTIIKLDSQVDHGPILGQETVDITPGETTPHLHKRLFEKGASLLAEVLPPYLEEKLIPREQDHVYASYTQQLTRQSGYFDVQKQPDKETLDRMIRAYAPWPGVWCRTSINGAEKIIKFLPDRTLQVEGKKPMTYKDFLNGYPDEEVIRGLIQKLS